MTKIISIGLNPPGGSAGAYTSAIYDNAAYYTAAYGVVTGQWAISEIKFNTTTGKYYFTLIHRTSSGNTARVRVRGYASGSTSSVNRISTMAVGSVYTTDTTTY